MNLAALLQGSPLQLLYEDAWYFALLKPSQLFSVEHGEKSSQPGKSVATLLLNACPDLEGVSANPGEAGLTQRLDFETSGILMGAKDRTAWLKFRDSLSETGVKKSYLVLLEGLLEAKRTINAPIGSPYRTAKRVRVYTPGRHPKGKSRAQDASTDFAPLRQDQVLSWTLARATTLTGRRHQVRAHASAIGHPLWGDSLYGSAKESSTLSSGAPQFLLHAEQIELTHPITRKPLTISAPAPDYFPKK